MAAQGQLILIAISLLGGFIDNLQDNSVLIRNAGVHHQYGALEDLVIGVLEQAKALFVTGVPEMGIPPLDPLVIDSLPLNLEYPGVVSATLELSEILVTGLSNYEVSDLDININGEAILPLDANMEITFNDLELVANYAMNGSLGELMDLSCDGILAVSLKKFKFRIIIATGAPEDHCGVHVLEKLSLGWQLESANVLVTGFMNDVELSKQISETLTFLLMTIVNDVEDLLDALISPKLQDFVNQILAFLFFKVPASSG